MSKQLLSQDCAEFCKCSWLLAAPNNFDILLSVDNSKHLRGIQKCFFQLNDKNRMI